MSFISGLFSKDKSHAQVEDGFTDDSASMNASKSDRPYVGMEVDVLSESKDFSFTGRVSNAGDDYLTIERLPGILCLPVIDVGSRIIVRGVRKDMSSFNAMAVVENSSRIACKLTSVESVPYVEGRNHFRVPVRVKGKLVSMDDKNPHSEDCFVLNVSEGGACVISRITHAEGEDFRLEVRLSEKTVQQEFISEIIRRMERKDGSFEYGLIFAQLNEKESTALAGTLFKVQTEKYHDSKVSSY